MSTRKNVLMVSFILFFVGCVSNINSLPTERVIQPPQLPIIEIPNESMNLFQLENGLEVLAIQNNSSPMVCLNMTIRVGSAHEEFSTSGMSHMLEHLLFNGTEKRTQEELYEETDYYGAFSNAYTRKFYTCFFFLLPAEFLEEGLDIQSDMLFHSTLPADKLEKERGIVIEEILQGRDSKNYEVQRYFDHINFGDTGVGLPTLGTLSTIENMKREDIYDFYKSFYVPNNMLLTIIGNFDNSTLKDNLEKFYGNEAPQLLPNKPTSPSHFMEISQSNYLNTTVLPTNQIQGQLIFRLPSQYSNSSSQLSEYSDAELTTGYEFFSDLLNDKLPDRLPEFDLGSYYVDYPGNELLFVEFSLDTENEINQAVAKITAELNDISLHLPEIITNDKVVLWSKQKLVEDISLLDSPHYYSMMKGDDLARSGKYAVDKLIISEKLSPQNIIQQFESTLQNPKNINIVFPEISDDEEIQDQNLNYSKTVLPSGATLIIAEGGGSPMFGMHVLIKNRNSIEGDLTGAAELLHSLLDSGTDQFSEAELQKQLDAIGAQTKFIDMSYVPFDNYYNSPEYGYIRLECLEEDAEIGIRLIEQMMSRTVLDEGKVEQAKSSANRRIMMQQSTARQIASEEFRKLLLGENHTSIGKVSGTMESIGKINLDNLKDFQQRYFRPENYIITISSRLPQNEIEAIFTSIWLGSGQPAARIKSEVLHNRSKQEKVIELGKEQAQLRLGYTFIIDETDKPAFSMMADILSDKMSFDLRETQGLAYSLGLSEGYDGRTAWLTASIGTGQENVEKSISGIKSYFDPSRVNDVTEKELQKTLNANKGRYMMRNLTRIGQTFYMGYYEYFGGDYSKAANKWDKYEEVTPAEIQMVAKKYLNFPENHSYLIVK